MKNNIEKYDIGDGTTYYDTLGLKADYYYQNVHVDITGELYDITKEPILKEYHDKWKVYRDTHKNIYDYLNIPPIDHSILLIVAISVMMISIFLLWIVMAQRNHRLKLWKKG